MRDIFRTALASALLSTTLAAALAVTVCAARADWRDRIAGAWPIRPARFEGGGLTSRLAALPSREIDPQDGVPGVSFGWSMPLVDRRLDPAARNSRLAVDLVDAIKRVEPIYDPTLVDGIVDITPMRISAGTAETRDIFGDHWRIASSDANVDAEARPLASAWTAGAAPRPCESYRVRRRHEWSEPALSAPGAADCELIRRHQAQGFSGAPPLNVAIAVPPLPIFAAPEPGSRQSSADFWTAQRARIASIHAHLHRKWAARSGKRGSMN